MKISRLTLFLLGSNAVLLWFYVNKPAPLPMAEIYARAASQPATVRSADLVQGDSLAPLASPVIVTNEFKWSQLEAEDYRTYIKRLRQIGCPEQTIRDIIIADLDKLMSPRFKALEPQEEPKYWKAEEKDLRPKDEIYSKLFQKQNLDFEKRQVIQELMGIDLVAERAGVLGETDAMSKRLNFLPTDKLSTVRMIHDRTALEESSIREGALATGDALSAGDKARLQKAQAERERQIAALLSPEEFERYQLWYSPSAFRARVALAPLNPTEEEFRAVYHLQSQFDSNWMGVDTENLPPELQTDYQNSHAALQEQVKEKLGTDRFKQFEEAQDVDYRQLRIASAQYGLSPETISDVLGFKKIVLDQRARLLTEPHISPAHREMVTAAINEETEKAVVEVMGPKAYQFYIKSGAGKWIKP
ncbi:MAG: hypothetical protein ACO1QB_03375 [Verrucomicrobiales bacterium]